MSEQECDYNKIKDYETAFRCFEQRFLKDKKSIFRLNANEEKDEILNTNSINYLINNFIEQGLDGDKGISFINKIELQLTGKVKIGLKEVSKNLSYPSTTNEDDQKKVQSEAIEVLAHCIWLWRLVPSNGIMDSTIKGVNEVLNLDKSLKNLDFSKNPFFNKGIRGIAKTGTYYNTNKPFELAFVIKFLHAYLAKSDDKSEIDLLNDLVNKCDKKVKEDCEIYIKTVGKLTKDGLQSVKEETVYKTASIFNALLFFFDPDNYEAIISNEHKNKIAKVFHEFCKDNDNIDVKLNNIKAALKEKYNLEDESIYFFYSSGIKQLWQGGIDFQAKNMILHGSPGTGKTYITDNTIKSILKFSNSSNKQYELVQFHPSFGYEEFIDGIKPIVNSSINGIQLELVNGIFKEMCINAFKELILAKKNNREPEKFYFVADEINRAELSRVFGELLLCLEEDKRLGFNKDGDLVGSKLKTQNASLWKKEHAVVIVNKDKVFETMDTDRNYSIDEKDEDEYDYYFGVPENLYFIGTMNDIDRSVDSFDIALRRRFVWKHYFYDEKVVEEDYLDKVDDDLKMGKLKNYLKKCRNLNNYITSENGFNLSESYMLGQSYFMGLSSFSDASLTKLWDEKIAPLLTEYLRVNFEGKQLVSKLKEAKEKFLPKTKS